MKGFRDWVFTQVVSSSVAASRPLSGSERFLGEQAPPELPVDQSQSSSSAESLSGRQHTSSSSSNNVESQFHVPQAQVPLEGSDQSHHDLNKRKRDTLEKIEDLQINFLRLVSRFGQSPSNNLLAAKVLYRMQLATLIRAEDSELTTVKLRNDRARAVARDQETTNLPELNFSLRILVLGKTGIGKSATINSVFDQPKSKTNAFHPATDQIQEVNGSVGGVKVTFIDTPGFLPSSTCSMRRNRKIMLSIKRYTKKHPPDVVLYLERLDLINMRYSDFPLLKLMAEVFGSAMWFNTILVMTHSSSLPEGSNGDSVSFESRVGQCTDLLQHYIHQAVSDTKLENPVLLVENHPQCKKNTMGDYVLPNGLAWKPQFLFLCICTKVLGDVNSLLKFQDSVELGQLVNTRVPSLPHLLSSFLQRRLFSYPAETETDQLLVSDLEEEDEYDQLPTIRVLTKSQFGRLSKAQKKAYLDELAYRETLYLKKQLKEECRRRQENKKLSEEEHSENNHDPNDQASQESVPLPDMAVPLSFSSDCPAHRYRSLATSEQWLVRPVFDPQGWDHDVGFDGINLETAVEIRKNLFASVAGQMSKDKDHFSIQSESNAAYSYPKGPTCSLGLDVQSTGKDLMYSIHGGSKLKTFEHNTTGMGVSLTSFANKHYVGTKLEDTLLLGRRIKLTMNMGQMEGSGQKVSGGSFEAVFRGRDFPVKSEYIGLISTAISLDKETIFSGGLQTEFCANRDTRVNVNANLNSRKMGQICVKLSSSEHLEIALVAVFSILKALLRRKGAIEHD